MAVSERKTTVYIPDKLVDLNILGRLALIAEKEDRSLNAIICQVLAEYVKTHGKGYKAKKGKASKVSKTPKPSPAQVSSTTLGEKG